MINENDKTEILEPVETPAENITEPSKDGRKCPKWLLPLVAAVCAVILVVAGIIVAATGFNPIWIIMTAQAVNGIFLPIIVFTLVYVTSRSRVMGQYKNSMIQNVLGAAVVLISLVIGINSLTSLF